MSDPELRARMGAAGRQRMVERFTWRETARKTVALYEEVLASAGYSCVGGSSGVVTRARPIENATYKASRKPTITGIARAQ